MQAKKATLQATKESTAIEKDHTTDIQDNKESEHPQLTDAVLAKDSESSDEEHRSKPPPEFKLPQTPQTPQKPRPDIVICIFLFTYLAYAAS